MLLRKVRGVLNIRDRKWLLLVLWSASTVLTACLPQTAQTRDIGIVFLKGDESTVPPRIYIKPAGGAPEAVSTISLGISDFRVLDQGLIAGLAEIQEYRTVRIQNIRDGSRQIGMQLEENEKFPLFSGDAASLLTVLPRGPGYGIVDIRLRPPHTITNIVLRDNNLYPQAWPCWGNIAVFSEPDTGKIYQLDIDERRLSDITPEFMEGDKPNWVSLSCDARTIAVSTKNPKEPKDRLYVYRDGRRVKIIDGENAIEPDLSKDGNDVVFVYGKQRNRILRYNIESDNITELVRDIGSLSVPQILPQ